MSDKIKSIKINTNIPTTAASSGIALRGMVSGIHNNPVIKAIEMDFSEVDFPMCSTDYKNYSDGEYLTSTGHILTIKNGVASVDRIIIANKTCSLPSSFKPTNVVKIVDNRGRETCLDKDVYNIFCEMKEEAAKDNINIDICSAYRSYSRQEGLYNDYVKIDGKEKADTYSARPGHSEHQTGLAIDINMANENFNDKPEAKWLNEHAAEFGFILRYPEGKSDITGYKYESWHYRYVGTELAQELCKKTIDDEGNEKIEWTTLEEHFGLNSVY